jgi:hypothetical protein
MITVPVGYDKRSPLFVYLGDEYSRGTLSFYVDGSNYAFTFYDPEDEVAFILKFGNQFLSFADDAGVYYCPYIPAGIK